MDTPEISPNFEKMAGEATAKDFMYSQAGMEARVSTAELFFYKIENLVAAYSGSKFYLLAFVGGVMIVIYSFM